MKEFDLKFFKVYGAAHFIMGFDVMLQKHPPSYVCSTTGKTPGINGWYLNGQLYSYLNAAIGVRGDYKLTKFDITVCSFSAAAMLYGEFIKPSYVEGKLACSYNILGAVKGNFDYEFQAGTKCQG